MKDKTFKVIERAAFTSLGMVAVGVFGFGLCIILCSLHDGYGWHTSPPLWALYVFGWSVILGLLGTMIFGLIMANEAGKAFGRASALLTVSLAIRSINKDTKSVDIH